MPELTALQVCQSDPAEHDETLFIIVHQVYELWFKQILHELDAAMRHIERDEQRPARWLLRRILEIQKILVAQISVLETMAPMEFLRFRDHLNPASGFQSLQFREIEAIGGVGSDRLLAMFAHDPDAAARLKARLGGPTLPLAWERLLRRRGLDYAEIPAGLPETEAAARRERRLDTLVKVYSDTAQHGDLHLLAELLLQFDQGLSNWRWRHIGMVERMIGSKPGTGGSEGVAYLQTTLGKKCFPELWEVRTRFSRGRAAYGGRAIDEEPSGSGAR